MKRRAVIMILLFAAVSIFLNCAPVSAGGIPEDTADGKAPGPFGLFSEYAAGRYSAETDEGLAVLELIPAFGRLFASVGLYYEGDSLYSYYMAELIPVCPDDAGFCPHEHSDHSFDFYVRLFSNLSYAGSYWPGETVQRLTLMPDGIRLSHFIGSGYALVSKTAKALRRDDAAPGMTAYGPEYIMTIPDDRKVSLPETMEGGWKASFNVDDTETTVFFVLDGDGTMVSLQDRGSEEPPLLLNGGFRAAEEPDGRFYLCYLLSSPASGLMPYGGCVYMAEENGSLAVAADPAEDEEALLPSGVSAAVYERAAE